MYRNERAQLSEQVSLNLMENSFISSFCYKRKIGLSNILCMRFQYI